MADNEQDQDIHHVLFNNLVLLKIMNHLDLENIKNVRLVCKAWSNEATNILGSRTKLNVFKMFEGPQSTSSFQVDSNLVKNINIGFSDRTNPATDTMKLITFFTEYHPCVQQLGYYTICEILPLFKILGALPFPALQKIDTHFHTFTLNKRKAVIPLEAVTAIETKPNLRNIQISCAPRTFHLRDLENLRAEGFDFSMDAGLKLSLQNLFNSAPNLNFFGYTLDSFALDLSTCTAIKRAELAIGQNGPVFDIDQLKVMLEQMSSSLEDLNLKMFSTHEQQKPILKMLMSLKSFPKLQKLTLNQLWKFVQLIGPNRFPKLKSIVMIGSSKNNDMEEYILSFGHVMKTIKSVTMSNNESHCQADKKYCFYQPQKLKSLFPNITEVVYKQRWKNTACVTDITFAKHLEELLKVCNEQRIDYLNVIVSKVTRFPDLDFYDNNRTVAVELKYLYREDAQLVNSMELRCEKVFFTGNVYQIATEEHAQTLMNILLSTKNMKSVVIQNMFLGIKQDEKLWTRICSFVEKHELPVNFSYTPIS